MKQINAILILCLIFSSCIKKNCKDDDLQIVKKDISGNVLRLDGFYYAKKDGVLLRSFVVPYRNGYCILANYPVDLERLERDLNNNSDLMIGIRKSKTHWGLIEIQNDTLKIDYWGVAKCERPLNRGHFKIVNDTTLLNYKNTSMRDMKDYFVNDTFYFRMLNPKPDSTNEFIK